MIYFWASYFDGQKMGEGEEGKNFFAPCSILARYGTENAYCKIFTISTLVSNYYIKLWCHHLLMSIILKDYLSKFKRTTGLHRLVEQSDGSWRFATDSPFHVLVRNILHFLLTFTTNSWMCAVIICHFLMVAGSNPTHCKVCLFPEIYQYKKHTTI